MNDLGFIESREAHNEWDIISQFIPLCQDYALVGNHAWSHLFTYEYAE